MLRKASCPHENLRSTHLLLDKGGYVIGVLLGKPRDKEGWKKAEDKAFDALQGAAEKISSSIKESTNRRGNFPSLAHGISFGGGQKVFAPFVHIFLY